MTKICRLALPSITAILLALVPLRAAEPVQIFPLGTLLPLMLNDNLDSDKSKPEQKLTAKLKQDVTLPDGTTVKQGSEVFGHIVSVNGKNGTAPARVVFVFDRIRVDKRDYPITVGARAMASMMAIYEARQPINSVAMDGSSPWDYNTRQVGGDIVYGRKGVRSEAGVVGMSPEPGWVVGVPLGNPDAGCPPPENRGPQSFWLFSTSACGVYGDGDEDMQISRKPDDNKNGEITLTAPNRVLVRGGAGLLLTVLPQPAVQNVK